MGGKIRLKVKVILVTVILISIIPIKVMAKASPIEFSNITVNDGLSQSNVEYIFQDSKGYIWIGTADGLNKYNGYEFKTYRYNENLPNSILGSHIYVIKEDDEGNIWVGTSNGLSKINVLTDEIKNYYNSESDGNLSHYNVCDILFSKKGNMLVATLDGLNLYDKNTDSFQRVLDKGDYILSGQTVYSIDQDEVGNLWVSTNKGLNKINVEKNEF
ncbi:MAG: ligand-binding sensor domain-containing protein, partial [Sarcina sp.]